MNKKKMYKLIECQGKNKGTKTVTNTVIDY